MEGADAVLIFPLYIYLYIPPRAAPPHASVLSQAHTHKQSRAPSLSLTSPSPSPSPTPTPTPYPPLSPSLSLLRHNVTSTTMQIYCCPTDI